MNLWIYLSHLHSSKVGFSVRNSVWIFLNFFAVTSHHFVEALVFSVSDFGWLPMCFKARVDLSLPTLCSYLHIMILLRVNSQFPSLDLVPILHLGILWIWIQFYPLTWIDHVQHHVLELPSWRIYWSLVHKVHTHPFNFLHIPRCLDEKCNPRKIISCGAHTMGVIVFFDNFAHVVEEILLQCLCVSVSVCLSVFLQNRQGSHILWWQLTICGATGTLCFGLHLATGKIIAFWGQQLPLFPHS